MGVLVTIVISIMAVISIFLLVALFVKRQYSISREILIDKPNDEVFDYVRHLKNQDHYSKWVMTDPNMQKSFKGQDGVAGFVYAWNGNNKAGEGEQEITKIIAGKKVDVEVRFERPFKAIAKTPIITEAISENETRVIWGMTGRYSYPMNFMNLFVDKLLGKDLELSLENLKKLLETQD